MIPQHRKQRAEPRSAARHDDEKPRPAPAKVMASDPDPVKKAGPVPAKKADPAPRSNPQEDK